MSFLEKISLYIPGAGSTRKKRGNAHESAINVHDNQGFNPRCGSAGLLIKCQLTQQTRRVSEGKHRKLAPLQLYGQEYTANTWAIANMNMITDDMEGKIEIGDTFRSPKFRIGGRLQTFDRVVANPMWNQDWFTQEVYGADELVEVD